MTWLPTNANDVTLIVSRVLRNDSGTRTGTRALWLTFQLVLTKTLVV